MRQPNADAVQYDQDIAEDAIIRLFALKRALGDIFSGIQRLIANGTLEINSSDFTQAMAVMDEELDDLLHKDYQRLLNTSQSCAFPAHLPSYAPDRQKHIRALARMHGEAL